MGDPTKPGTEARLNRTESEAAVAVISCTVSRADTSNDDGAEKLNALSLLVTFRVSRRRREMYSGHASLCVCLSAAACPHHCTDPDVTWGMIGDDP